MKEREKNEHSTISSKLLSELGKYEVGQGNIRKLKERVLSLQQNIQQRRDDVKGEQYMFSWP